MKVLSTKKLSLSQRELLLNAGLQLVEYDAIKISFLTEKLPKNIKNGVFSSQNGVKSVFLSKKGLSKVENCFCVGEKTRALLEENGQKVMKTASNSAELGHFIANNYKNEAFYYFCSTIRRDELPEIIKYSENELFEIKTYKTEPNLKKFEQKWNGILFFSPSGVQSFTSENSMENSIAFCIGETTAKEAKKYSKNVIVANTTTTESVIAKAAKTLC
ncbi:uroporphyrinogen-III synthase [Patiriisocius hiemis]|uniref:Uroporphyrinogen-III synthase n=1 Tax=Patiriisocius hiemis TaxID=3075604 RepID=A0ABU2YBD5_9FLAO|nr:uroporphyrinogen-III synthase [Constantimarinum sp. W242]MDT0555500.1 uroporphyrinogen-III synthase [Constantimarinum sp. W242]